MLAIRTRLNFPQYWLGITAIDRSREILQGSLKTTHTFNSTTRFEIVEQPKLGTLGWNNSLAGKVIYSPIYVTRLTRTDNFTYRAVNDYGESNWAVVNIEFDHDNESDGVLKTIVGIAILSVGASLGG